MTDENPRAVVGGNGPPADPFDAIAAHIADLYDEAKGFLDGEPIASEAMAAAVEDLLAQIRDVEKVAEAARKVEKDPLDEQVAAIQAKWNPLIGSNKSVTGKTVLAAETCKAALAPWRRAQEAVKQEAARIAREEAGAAQRAAMEAMRASAADDLAAKETAEQLLRDADEAAKLAARATKAATTGTGLRSIWTATMIEPVLAARWAWEKHRQECEAFFQTLADGDARRGVRVIPGFAVEEIRNAT